MIIIILLTAIVHHSLIYIWMIVRAPTRWSRSICIWILIPPTSTFPHPHAIVINVICCIKKYHICHISTDLLIPHTNSSLFTLNIITYHHNHHCLQLCGSQESLGLSNKQFNWSALRVKKALSNTGISSLPLSVGCLPYTFRATIHPYSITGHALLDPLGTTNSLVFALIYHTHLLLLLHPISHAHARAHEQTQLLFYFNAWFVGTVLRYWQEGTGGRDQTFFRPFISKPAPNLSPGARNLNQQGFGLGAATRLGQKGGYNYLFRRHFILPELPVGGQETDGGWVGGERVALCLTVHSGCATMLYWGMMAWLPWWHSGMIAQWHHGWWELKGGNHMAESRDSVVAVKV